VNLANHFKKINPVSIRLMTDKETGKCRGSAFVELEDWDRMNTALKLYHHTQFEDGESKKRRINVELTAGAGGAGSIRKEKIKGKNDKLYEERRQEQQKKKLKEADGGGDAKPQGNTAQNDIHPSRRAMMGM